MPPGIKALDPELSVGRCRSAGPPCPAVGWIRGEQRAALSRKQRLPLEAYEVEGTTWHVTTRVDQRIGSPFRDEAVGRFILQRWTDGCQRADSVPHLVCLMPDHLHMIVEVRSIGLIELMRRLKSYSTAIWRARTGQSVLWQQSFYDHGLREQRDFEAAVTYILSNPVQSGLVERWEQYPLFAGELVAGAFET